uniref:GB1/RHD3-type G domain-containing protein n=1 Tax=Alexandrium monilatum TaxID=311494 RepID=A0A7S4Q2C9_9DINO
MPSSVVVEPVQLLRVCRHEKHWQYEVCPEGARLLESHGSRRIAVTTICGLYRTGKSYILNLLLERLQRKLPLFQVGGTTRACTEGLWLWGSVDSESPAAPLMAFVDCEGFGSTDSDRTRDAQLMTLCALLSSVLVLNTKGALSEGLFSALALCCRFAEHVEERGNEASRPSLMWVLRDFQLELLDPHGRPISPSEYLEQALRAAPAAGYNAERGEAAQEVRQSLLRFFNQRSCVTLVRPAIEEEDLQQLERLPYASLRSEFRAGVEALRSQLVSQCHHSPKAVGGQPISCIAFVALMRQLVTAMNEDSVLSIRGAWDSVQHSACVNLTEELRTNFCGGLRAMAEGKPLPNGAQLPMPDESLEQVLKEQRNRVKVIWQQQAVGDEEVRLEYWKELEEQLHLDENAVRERNVRLADKQLSDAGQRWLQWLEDDAGSRTAGERACQELLGLMQRMPSAPLCRAAATALEASARRVARARGEALAERGHARKQAENCMSQAQRREQEEGRRKDLEGKVQDLEVQLERARQALAAEQSAHQAQDVELQNAKAHSHAAQADLEALRAVEHELRAQLRNFAERESHLESENQRLAAEAAAAETERLSSERSARIAGLEAKTSTEQRQRLESQLQEHTAKLAQFQGTLDREKAEHQALQSRHEQLQRQHDEGDSTSKRQREAERQELRDAKQNLALSQEQVKTLQADIQGMRAQLQATEGHLASSRTREQDEVSRLHRAHAEREAQLREQLEWAKSAATKAESKAIASDKAARKARWEADTLLEEKRWLEAELKRLSPGGGQRPGVERPSLM